MSSKDCISVLKTGTVAKDMLSEELPLNYTNISAHCEHRFGSAALSNVLCFSFISIEVPCSKCEYVSTINIEDIVIQEVQPTSEGLNNVLMNMTTGY